MKIRTLSRSIVCAALVLVAVESFAQEQVETSNGTQQVQMASVSNQYAPAQLEATARNSSSTTSRYVEQTRYKALMPEANIALLKASGGLLASIFMLVVANHYLRRYFKI